MADKLVEALECAEYALTHPQSDQGFALRAVQAALAESKRSDCTLVPNSALRWLFGEEGDFFDRGPARIIPEPFWWRSEFRRRITEALAQSGAGQAFPDWVCNHCGQRMAGGLGKPTICPNCGWNNWRQDEVQPAADREKEVRGTCEGTPSPHPQMDVCKNWQPLAQAGETSAEWDARVWDAQLENMLAAFIGTAMDEDDLRNRNGILKYFHDYASAYAAGRAASGGQQPASMLLSQKCIWSESLQGWIAPNKKTHDNLVELFNRLAASAAPELSIRVEARLDEYLFIEQMIAGVKEQGWYKRRIEELNALLRASQAGSQANQNGGQHDN